MHKSNQNTKKILALALVLLGMSGGVLALAFYSLSKERVQLETVTQEVEAELQKGGQRAAEISLLNETKRDREKIATYFVGEGEVVEVLQKIESIGMLSGAAVTVNSVTDETVAKKKAKKSDSDEDKEKKEETPESLIRLGISAEGDWLSVYRFLSLLELLPLAQSVERVSLEKTHETEIKNDDTLPEWKGLFEIKLRKEKLHESK